MPSNQQQQLPNNIIVNTANNPPAPTTGRRRKANQQNLQHVSPISQNSSTLNSPNPNIAPSPNQRQLQNPAPPYSPATSSVNPMRVPSYSSPPTPSSIDNSLLTNNKNSPKSIHNMGNSLDQMNPLSPAPKKLKNSNIDSFENSIGDEFGMNSKMNSKPQLMPVPSPQKIQYSSGFDELTIQRQPNTSILSPILNESELINPDFEFIDNLDNIYQPNQPMNQSNLNQQNPQFLNQNAPPQFINQPGMPQQQPNQRLPQNNSPYNQSQLINQPQPNMLIGDNNSTNNLPPNNRFQPNQQFDPRMQPNAFNQPPPPSQQLPPQNINQNRFDMFNNRMPNQIPPNNQSQFKNNNNQLVGNPYNPHIPISESPMASLQKMAHTIDDTINNKIDNNSSINSQASFNSSSINQSNNSFDSNLINNSNNQMINRPNLMNQDINCIGGGPIPQNNQLPPINSQPNRPGPGGLNQGPPPMGNQYSNAPPPMNQNQFNTVDSYQMHNPNNLPPNQQFLNQPPNCPINTRPSPSPMLMNSHNSQFPSGNSVSPKLGLNTSPSPIPGQQQLINGNLINTQQPMPPGAPQRPMMTNPNLHMNNNPQFNMQNPSMNPRMASMPYNTFTPNAPLNNKQMPMNGQNMHQNVLGGPRGNQVQQNVQMNVQQNKPNTIGYQPVNRPINNNGMGQPAGIQQRPNIDMNFLPKYNPPMNNQPGGNVGPPHFAHQPPIGGNEMMNPQQQMPPQQIMQRGGGMQPQPNQLMSNDSTIIPNQQPIYRQQQIDNMQMQANFNSNNYMGANYDNSSSYPNFQRQQMYTNQGN